MEEHVNFCVSYCEAVFCLELVVHIDADPVKVFHFRTGLNAPGKERAEQRCH